MVVDHLGVKRELPYIIVNESGGQVYIIAACIPVKRAIVLLVNNNIAVKEANKQYYYFRLHSTGSRNIYAIPQKYGFNNFRVGENYADGLGCSAFYSISNIALHFFVSSVVPSSTFVL